MLRGNVEEESIFLTPNIFFPIPQCMNNPNPVLAINTNLYCFSRKSPLDIWKWPNLQNRLMDWGIKYVTWMPCSSGTSADSVQWKHSISQERIDYCSRQQMPLPVNNVEGKQQLNDQSHYSSRQIKATRDSDVVFTMCVHVCRGSLHVPAPYCIYICVSAHLCICVCKCVCVWGMPAWVIYCSSTQAA